MKFCIFLTLILIIFTGVSCTEEETEGNEEYAGSAALDAETQLEKISELEQQFSRLMTTNPDSPDFTPSARYLAEEYRLFADNHSEHEEAAEMMFRAANLQADALESPSIAVGLFRQVQRRWPDSEQADRSLFLAGYTYNHGMGRHELARDMYEKLLVEYPDSELRQAVEDELRFMGSDPEEFLREFRNQDD